MPVSLRSQTIFPHLWLREPAGWGDHLKGNAAIVARSLPHGSAYHPSSAQRIRLSFIDASLRKRDRLLTKMPR